MAAFFRKYRLSRAALCMVWSIGLSLPLWVGALAIGKVVLVPEADALATRLIGVNATKQIMPPGGVYARFDPRQVLREGRSEAHKVAEELLRHG